MIVVLCGASCCYICLFCLFVFSLLQGKSKMKNKKNNERAMTDDKSKIYLFLFLFQTVLISV